MPHLLVIDHDHQLCTQVSNQLQENGYQVSCCHSSDSAQSVMQSERFDLIILDSQLPCDSSYRIAQKICQRFATPILMVCPLGNKNALLNSFQSGADHYLPKPFDVEVLIAKISAILRRVGLEKQRNRDPAQQSDTSKMLEKVPLTNTETDLLRYMMKRNQSVVTKAQLQKEVLKKELTPFDRNLDMHISNIRRKLVGCGLPKTLIKTVRGQGYTYTE
ncbi:response regulator transcription factor [Vibrio sp. SCSIO 43136]|uniref:response regulator transcription factor n=1 Tax=Vibrio sp. SCSIO 43136 TaxID=2819101 RepID=UPI002075CFFE|nr:response regulator transcription factor [Vibrio sp. SCSIO 43136]USD67022.1 response regulator transcription factor [Vibrio sp. SCSIO 43136]